MVLFLFTCTVFLYRFTNFAEKMSNNKNDSVIGEEATKHKSQPGDGIRSMRSSYAFRVINYELYAKPSKSQY